MSRKWTWFIVSLTVAILIKGQVNKERVDSSAYLVTRLSINSNRGDFSPWLQDGKLYFSSGRVHRYGLVYFNEDTLKELEDIFYAEKIDSVNFKHPHYFSEKVNTKFNDGPLCFNKTGDVLYVTGNDLKRINQHIEPLDIFVSHKANGHWEVPVSLPFCTGTASYAHPALMADGKTLIFSSDMPGGFGGMDLYKTVFKNGTWSAPENMGPKVNSKGNELFSYVTTNDILYFSSNRDKGLDVFSIELKNSEAILVKEGWPFNTEKDDFGVWLDSSGTWGYFSSDRGGNDDIYYFRKKYPSFSGCVAQKAPAYCYTFYEESSMQSEDTLGMIYEWDLGDGTKKRGLSVRHCYTKPGDYEVQLNIVDKGSGALFYNELSYNFAVEEAKRLFIDCPDTVITGKLQEFNSERSVIPGYKIAERFWYFGDGAVSTGAKLAHRYAENGTYLVKHGVFARNDSTGKVDRFCVEKMVLVMDSAWLKQHQKSLTKVTWPPPQRVDSVYHAKEGGDVNFRVHLGTSEKDIPLNSQIFSNLKDVNVVKEKDKFHYTSGKVKKVTEATPYYRKAKEKGFKNAVVIGYKNDSIIKGQERALAKSKLNEKMVTVNQKPESMLWHVNVFFDFNKRDVPKGYYKSLDSVCRRLKKDKKLELIVLAISDTVGTSEYNYKLSGIRAGAVRDYLLKKGVAQTRMEVIAVGETSPVPGNSQKNVLLSNRRVEVIIVEKPE